MRNRPEMSLSSKAAHDGVVLTDHACGVCTACSTGARLWCSTPALEGRELTPALPAERAEDVADALLAVAALAEAPADATVLLLVGAESVMSTLVGRFASGRLVVADDPGAARSELATEPTGRAAVVIAGPDARVAVRAVRRGGHVCVVDPTVVMPSVTELVQREVTLLAPRDAAAVAGRIAPDVWASLTAA